MSESDDQIGILLAARTKTYRRLLLKGLIVQLAAILIGAVAISRCIDEDPTIERRFQTANRMLKSLWYATVWPAYFTVRAVPISLVVVLSLAFLVYFGIRWPRVHLLSYVGILGWGVWWVWCAYVLCLLD